MSTEKTLSIVKPDAMQKRVLGKILARFEDAGLEIVAGRVMSLTRAQAQEFYKEHAERPFYGELVEYMTSGPVFVSVLKGEGAIAMNRKVMGATDPKKADAGTIRADFGDSVGANAVHGSDSSTSAEREISFFFPELNS
jgi:nucleoside-diphosphate kinase